MGPFANLPANLSGAWDVMNGRAEGLNKFDLTIDGFWRSFGAIVLILPVALIALASERVVLPARPRVRLAACPALYWGAPPSITARL